MGKVIHIVASGANIYFQGTRPTMENGKILGVIKRGHRISVLPVNAFGGKGWYVVSASGVLDDIKF